MFVLHFLSSRCFVSWLKLQSQLPGVWVDTGKKICGCFKMVRNQALREVQVTGEHLSNT